MKETLIEVVKTEHEALKQQVALVKSKGVMTPAGFAELIRLKELLQVHIEHEDRLMYPRLEQAAEQDRGLKALVTRFRDEMDEITVAAEKFFRCYAEPVPSLEYAKEVGSLFSMLTNRIITEEKVLFPHLL
jgi:iron-sulfur cluster repair protein YtfE (RIC family)